MKRDQLAILKEVERLTLAGIIRAVEVVEAARDEESPLHELFIWDNTKAGHEYRLIQARKILQIYVVVQQSSAKNVRAFVSLTSDRIKEGGGYRVFAEVMDDELLRQQLLEDALVQFRNMRRKYEQLKKLAKVWEALDEVEVGAEESNAA